MKTFDKYTIPGETDVVIVGAGPTGLALAAGLQQAGVRHVILDKLTAGLNTSRAGVVHAHTLDMLEHIGVSSALSAAGMRMRTFSIRDRDRALLQLQFDGLPTEHSYLLMIPQDATERILTERLEELGGGVHRGVTATAVEANEGTGRGAVVRLEGGGSVHARYVVGGDGMHSLVRQAAGVGFEGETYGDSFVLADVELDWPLAASEVSLFFSPSGLLVVAPLPGGTFRVVATVEQAPERPDRADIQALFDERAGRGANRVGEVVWSSRFRIHHRLASSYRKGCLFLMGDAAHVHSPAGGQGMNTGLVDAMVLCRLLEQAVVKGDVAVLDAYERLRRPAAGEVLELAGRLTRLATVRSAPRRLLRNLLLAAANAVPPFKQKLLMSLSGLSRRHFAEVRRA